MNMTSENDFDQITTAGNFREEDFEKLLAYESKSWRCTSDTSLKVIAPYVRTIRKWDLEAGMTTDSQIGTRFTDTITIEEEIWDANVFQMLKVNVLSQTPLINSILETSKKLKVITDSDIALVYIVDVLSKMIYRISRDFEKLEDLERWKVGGGTVLAAFVAQAKEFLITDDVYGDMRFPKGMDCNDMFVENVMAVPILSPNKEVKIVLEFARTVGKDVYTSNELNSVISCTSWIGHAIFSSELSQLRLKETSILQHVMNIITKNSMSSDKALAEIMIFVKYLIGALKAAFFIINKEDGRHMYADFYEEVRENKLIAVQKRILITDEDVALKKAVMSQQIVNVKDTIAEATYKGGIKYSGKTIKSSLCLPIVSNGETKGVLQLINKKMGQQFTEEDELLIQNFSEYFMMTLNFLTMNKNVEKRNYEQMINRELLSTHFNPCEHSIAEIAQKLETIPENFMTFSWYPGTEDLNRLAQLSVVYFREVFGDDFMSHNNVDLFILTVQKFYRPNSFHNFLHAFVSAHTMANIITRNQDLFSRFEKKALMISSICLDLDHRGYTNRFIQITNHPLSHLYKKSPLENHHIAMTQKIMKQCNFCTSLKHDAYQKLVLEIDSCIKSTDLENYFSHRKQLVHILKNKEFSWADDTCRKLVKSLLMTVCDLSCHTKPYYVAKKVTECINKEFFNQGDMEKKMGLVPHPSMDRKNNKINRVPETQVEFLNSVVMPCCFVIAKLIPNTAELFQGCRNLRRQWTELIKTADEDVWFPDESFLEEYANKST